MGDYWATSTDEEIYTGNYPTREDAMWAMLEMDGDQFWIGRVTDSWNLVDTNHAVESMLEQIDCSLSEEISGDGPLIELAKAHHAELAEIIRGFLIQHAELSKRVVDVEKIEERPDSEEIDR